MQIELLVKLTPDDKQEAIDFAKHHAALVAYFEELRLRGGIPPETQIRWLLRTRRFE